MPPEAAKSNHEANQESSPTQKLDAAITKFQKAIQSTDQSGLDYFNDKNAVAKAEQLRTKMVAGHEARVNKVSSHAKEKMEFERGTAEETKDTINEMDYAVHSAEADEKEIGEKVRAEMAKTIEEMVTMLEGLTASLEGQEYDHINQRLDAMNQTYDVNTASGDERNITQVDLAGKVAEGIVEERREEFKKEWNKPENVAKREQTAAINTVREAGAYSGEFNGALDTLSPENLDALQGELESQVPSSDQAKAAESYHRNLARIAENERLFPDDPHRERDRKYARKDYLKQLKFALDNQNQATS